MMPGTLDRIRNDRLIAVIRTDSADVLPDVVASLGNGGLNIVEITLTIPGAVNAIRDLVKSASHHLIGAGTVLTVDQAKQVIDAGAAFVVSPIVDHTIIETCKIAGVPVMPGALTPTEIVAAWNAGADVVKLFPADPFGPAYLKALKGPLPHVRLMPTGGVDLSNTKAYLDAGACCLGVGGKLVDNVAIRNRDFAALTRTARAYRDLVPLLSG